RLIDQPAKLESTVQFRKRDTDECGDAEDLHQREKETGAMFSQRIVQRERVTPAAADAQPLGEMPQLLFLECDVVAELAMKFPERQDCERHEPPDRGGMCGEGKAM